MISPVNPPYEDLLIRKERTLNLMREAQIEAAIISSNVNLYYLTGQIVNGYLYLDQSGQMIAFARRPFHNERLTQFPIRKLENIPDLLREHAIALPASLGLEKDTMPYSEASRFLAAFPTSPAANLSTLMRTARMVKTPWEINQMRISAQTHVEVYRQIPSLYRPGMRDIDLQIAIEKTMREHGSIGLFRAYGNNTEVHMGSVLVGTNAGEPTPYDFALGGTGTHPALPLGASGESIEEGKTVMVDMAGNYTAYISDISRVYTLGRLPELALRAHQLSIDLHDHFRQSAREGTPCASLYNHSLEAVEEAQLSDYFMGYDFQAKFVGHGAGIEINEPPVLMGRSKDLLQAGMTIAFEPKFVIPGVGAVGVENTYLIHADHAENLTEMEENIIEIS